MTPIIELRGVSKRFGPTYDAAARMARGLGRRLGRPAKNETVQAVDRVDLAIARGEVVGLVGESGCGKSTLGRMVAGIMRPSEGQVLFQGADVTTLPPAAAKQAKLKVQMIFQDPYASLNPRLRVADIVGEAPLVHGMVAARRLRRLRGRATPPRRAGPRNASAASPTSSPAVSGSASASPAHSRCNPSSWCATKPWRRSTFRSRHKSSTSSWTCGASWT